MPPHTSANRTVSLDPAENLKVILARIEQAKRAAIAPADRVQLIAVTKTHGAERILPILQAGHRIFGENRVQEAKAKWPELRLRYPDIELHLIGPLQSNKTSEAVAFVRYCREELQLPVIGLMCIPPMSEEPALHFALLNKLAKEAGVQSLSMGMSEDFETAIRFGATHVRIGTAIFGPR